jgi:hypothetical protein
MAENCIEINNKNLQSWLFSSSRNQDKANIVVDYFNPKEGETPTPFESFI